jgi:proteasome lid subunit RPN8/RPN11
MLGVGHCMTARVTVSISLEILDAIFEGAKRLYPRETILLLRGKKRKDSIQVLDLVVPPFAAHGHGFADIPIHMLPSDFSIVGTVHSHPSGNILPSHVDLNHFFGRILMIVGFPFAGEKDVAVYDSNGEKLQLQITAP